MQGTKKDEEFIMQFQSASASPLVILQLEEQRILF